MGETFDRSKTCSDRMNSQSKSTIVILHNVKLVDVTVKMRFQY